MRIVIQTTFCALFLGIGFTSCRHTDTDPFTAEKFDAFDDSLGQRVEAYQQTVFSENGNKKEGRPSLYIDFSSGIYQALSLPSNQKLLNAVYADLSGGLDVFKLNKDSILPTANDPVAVGKLVMDKKNYQGQYAPIQKAVEQIVLKSNDAILITDFEEYFPPKDGRGEITDVPYLKESFINWLSKGNTIHFFISDYQEGGVNKHLFFTVFNYGNITNASLVTRVQHVVKGLTELTRFDLSDKSFALSQDYGAEKTGGIFYDLSGKTEKAINVLDMRRDQYINGLKSDRHFEFYRFGLDWKTIGWEKESYNKQNQFNDFFRKIFIDISNEDSYHIDALSVKVNDVTEDFEQFAKCREVIKHQPHIVKGSNGEDKFADTEKDRIAQACYDPGGKMKEQWIYHNQPVNEVPEVFVFNKALFDNSMKNSGRQKAELAVSFDTKFNVKNIPSTARLLRVDIVVEKATTAAANGKMEKFSWTSTTKKPALNTALAASITNALAEPKVKPDQHVIYSYYIKTLDN